MNRRKKPSARPVGAPDDSPMAPRQAARSEDEIFAELSALCASPGFIHAIAYFCERDNLIRFAGELTAEDMGNLYGRSRLVRNEVNLLFGLAVKVEIDYEFPEGEVFQAYMTRSESLLEELHQAMLLAVPSIFSAASDSETPDPMSSGAMIRESIFYGGESAYSFQYRDFSPLKYGRDDDWLVANKGYSIHDGRKVVWAAGMVHNDKATKILARRRGGAIDPKTCLASAELTLAEVAARAKLSPEVVARVFDAFTLPAGERNAAYQRAQDFNMVSAFPLLRRGEAYVMLNIYDLAESFYQSPFHWMWNDKAYRPTAMENRGKFTEEFSASRLSEVFGKDRVHINVNLRIGKDIVGEIDVLVVFADVAIVLQAKSKQLTIEARQGVEGKLRSDFEKAIQDSCDQGYSCAQFLLDGKAELLSESGATIAMPNRARNIYIMCVVSDHYPSLSFQARQFLKVQPAERISAPFVMDVFFLDALAEMLDSPLLFLSYVDRRLNYDDKIMSSHELNILGYHLRHNLWLTGEYDLVMLEDDVSTPLEVSMLVRRENLPGPWTPAGVLTEFDKTMLGAVLNSVRKEPNPAMLAFGFLALSIGGRSVREISAMMEKMIQLARADKGRHNMSLMFGSVGVTFHCNYESPQVASDNLQAYCIARKYVQKASEWFGICLDPKHGSIRFGFHLDDPWQHDSKMDEATKSMPWPGKAKNINFKQVAKKEKIGRNDPCMCGSGVKYKRCCGA